MEVDGACCGQGEGGVVWAAGVDVFLGEVEDVWEEFDGSSGNLMGGLCE